MKTLLKVLFKESGAKSQESRVKNQDYYTPYDAAVSRIERSQESGIKSQEPRARNQDFYTPYDAAGFEVERSQES